MQKSSLSNRDKIYVGDQVYCHCVAKDRQAQPIYTCLCRCIVARLPYKQSPVYKVIPLQIFVNDVDKLVITKVLLGMRIPVEPVGLSRNRPADWYMKNLIYSLIIPNEEAVISRVK